MDLGEVEAAVAKSRSQRKVAAQWREVRLLLAGECGQMFRKTAERRGCSHCA